MHGVVGGLGCRAGLPGEVLVARIDVCVVHPVRRGWVTISCRS